MSEANTSQHLPLIRRTRWTRVGSWLFILHLLPALIAASTAPQLELALFDRVRLSPAMFDEMAGELDRVLPARNAEIVWLVANDQLVIHSPQGEIQVILSPSLPEVWGFDETVMGAVLSGGRKDPGGVIVVFPARVAQVVGAQKYLKFPRRARRDPRLARALARVIAHEIIHAVAPDHLHGQDGLMHASQTRASLLEPGSEVDSACLAVFETRLPEYLSRVSVLAAATTPTSEAPVPSTPE